MLKRSILAGVWLILAGILAVACDSRQPAGVPPTQTTTETSVAATDAPAAAASVAAVLAASPSPTMTAELTATATVTATLPPEVVVLEAVNIRGGPSQDYPIVGYVAGGNWSVTGRSADGAWWRIECPQGTPSEECWITASEGFVESANATAAPLAAAPPLPTATLAPTATPCVVSPGAGWTSYQVQSGDTLSGLAARFGGSAGQIMAANCLASDAIVAGSSLWVPAGGASPTGASSPTAIADNQDRVFAAGIAAVLGFTAPGSMPCPAGRPQVNTTDLQVFIGERANLAKDTWEIAEGVCIYVVNATAGEPVTVTIRLPNGEQRDADLLGGPTSPWTFIPKPGDPAGAELGYSALARQGDKVAAAVFHVTRASEPRLRVLPPQDVSPGGGVDVVVAGWPSGAPLYLYSLNSSGQQPCAVASAASLACGEGAEPASESEHFCLVEQLPQLSTDQFGEAAFVFWTRNRPLDTYLLHDGQCEDIGLSDVRLFTVLEP